MWVTKKGASNFDDADSSKPCPNPDLDFCVCCKWPVVLIHNFANEYKSMS